VITSEAGGLHRPLISIGIAYAFERIDTSAKVARTSATEHIAFTEQCCNGCCRERIDRELAGSNKHVSDAWMCAKRQEPTSVVRDGTAFMHSAEFTEHLTCLGNGARRWWVYPRTVRHINAEGCKVQQHRHEIRYEDLCRPMVR
jgi:hypothetical protein